MPSQVHYAIVGPMRTLATVREAVEPAVFAAAFAAGQQLSLEEAFAGILAPSALANASLERVQIAETMV